jgi:hypothetical protein
LPELNARGLAPTNSWPRQALPCEHTFFSEVAGLSGGRFTRAVQRGQVDQADLFARELPNPLPLEYALRPGCLYASAHQSSSPPRSACSGASRSRARHWPRGRPPCRCRARGTPWSSLRGCVRRSASADLDTRSRRGKYGLMHRSTGMPRFGTPLTRPPTRRPAAASYSRPNSRTAHAGQKKPICGRSSSSVGSSTRSARQPAAFSPSRPHSAQTTAGIALPRPDGCGFPSTSVLPLPCSGKGVLSDRVLSRGHRLRPWSKG